MTTRPHVLPIALALACAGCTPQSALEAEADSALTCELHDEVQRASHAEFLAWMRGQVEAAIADELDDGEELLRVDGLPMLSEIEELGEVENSACTPMLSALSASAGTPASSASLPEAHLGSEVDADELQCGSAQLQLGGRDLVVTTSKRTLRLTFEDAARVSLKHGWNAHSAETEAIMPDGSIGEESRCYFASHVTVDGGPNVTLHANGDPAPFTSVDLGLDRDDPSTPLLADGTFGWNFYRPGLRSRPEQRLTGIVGDDGSGLTRFALTDIVRAEVDASVTSRGHVSVEFRVLEPGRPLLFSDGHDYVLDGQPLQRTYVKTPILDTPHTRAHGAILPVSLDPDELHVLEWDIHDLTNTRLAPHSYGEPFSPGKSATDPGLPMSLADDQFPMTIRLETDDARPTFATNASVSVLEDGRFELVFPESASASRYLEVWRAPDPTIHHDVLTSAAGREVPIQILLEPECSGSRADRCATPDPDALQALFSDIENRLGPYPRDALILRQQNPDAPGGAVPGVVWFRANQEPDAILAEVQRGLVHAWLADTIVLRNGTDAWLVDGLARWLQRDLEPVTLFAPRDLGVATGLRVNAAAARQRWFDASAHRFPLQRSWRVVAALDAYLRDTASTGLLPLIASMVARRETVLGTQALKHDLEVRTGRDLTPFFDFYFTNY